MSGSVGRLSEFITLLWADATRFVKVRLLTVLALVVIAAVLTALGPVALKMVVDGLAAPNKDVAPSPQLLIGLYVLSQWLARSIGEVRGLVYARAERRMFRTVSERLFAHLMQLPLRFHLERQTGAINQILANGLQGYQMILHHLVFTLLPVLFELATVVLILGRLAQPVFLGLFCGAFLCYAAVFAYAVRTVARTAKSASAAHVAAIAVMTDSILNYEAVKYCTAEAHVQERLRAELTQTEVKWVRSCERSAFNGLGVAAIYAIFLFATAAFAVSRIEAHQMTVGDFVLVNTYMLQLTKPLEMIGFALQALSQGLAMLTKLLEVFREPPEPQRADTLLPASGSGQLEFESVSASYTPGRSVLKGVSFRVPAGHTLGVVGASGSGKSTVVRLLVRLLEPVDGRILLDGTPISAMSLQTLRQAIAVVPQESLLLDETIAYNIAFGRRGTTQVEIERAAKLAHLHEFILSLPEQYQTRVGERGVKLSGGEKQRLSIARAVVRQPRIYVFDEATSSLDSVSERQIVENLRELSLGSTTLVIAHRLSTVAHADVIAVLADGTVVEQGTHDSLLRRGGSYAALWAAQQKATVAA